jgi:cell division protein ZapE
MPTTAAPPNDSLQAHYGREIARHGFDADSAQLGAVERLEALRQHLVQASAASSRRSSLGKLLGTRPVAAAPRGIYLWGGVGRGKTWLIDLLYDSLTTVPRKRQHFHHFMRDVHAQLGKLKQQPEPLKLVASKLAKEVGVLCLDELYVSDIADAMILGGLFEALLASGVTLAITSNAAPDMLYRDGLQRARFLPAIKLLQSKLEVHHLKGSVDLRLRQMRRAAIYLGDNDAAAARTQMSELFARLAGEHGEHDARLRIAGRPIAAWRRSSGIVWFGFDALCEGARSQNDYIEIAAEFHTVFLSDVPIFNEQRDDAARRFIALVDEFYDQGVKLVLSAAAAPTGLYRGERLRFEFQRTASRLIEMQSEAYLRRAHRRKG